MSEVVDDPGPQNHVVLALRQEDGSDPVVTITCKPEDTVDWLLISDVIGDVVRVDESFNITFGEDHEGRLSKIFGRKLPEDVLGS